MAQLNFVERALTFGCCGETLVGILAEPEHRATVGTIIIVGGPQYRVGSHRQFVLLSRHLARSGIAALRFDYRGMGDSTGAPMPFDEVAPDIAAAIDAIRASCPTVKRIVLWGLCDAASAALIYCQATRDTRVGGIILVNPWVRSQETIARTRIKHYYGRRILQKGFWAKVVRGRLDVGGAARTLARTVIAARGKATENSEASTPPFQDRMAEGLRAFDGPVLLILSGQDLTAREFLEYAGSNPLWAGLIHRPKLLRRDLDDSDHTFSSDRWRRQVETFTFDWLSQCFPTLPE